MTTMLGWLRVWWARVLVGLILVGVAGVTGRISYVHIEALSVALHQPQQVARIMPFGVDGLVLVGSVVLLQSGPGQEWLGWLGVGPGVAASLFANVESGIRFGWLSAIWAGVASVSFALACFIAERWLYAQASRSGSAGSANARPDHGVDANACPHGIAGTAEEAAILAFLHARDCLGQRLSQRHLSTAFGLPRSKVAELVGKPGQQSDDVPETDAA